MQFNEIKFNAQIEFIKYFLDVLSSKEEFSYYDVCIIEEIFDFLYEKLQ